MSDLLIGLLSAALATNQPAAVSNLVTQTTGLSITIPDPNDPVEKEYQKLLEDDDAAQEEVEKWIHENLEFASKGGGLTPTEMNARIDARFSTVRRSYEDFLKRHPDHARGHLAYGGFLMDIHDFDDAEPELEKARALNPKDPTAWNQLANIYTHTGPTEKIFEYYGKAIELNPLEPVYYQNLADSVFLFRPDAMKYWHITEQQVFDKSLDLYRQAMKLDPTNFPLATLMAQSYYGIKPTRTDEALNAWTNALNIAPTETEKEGVYIHMARFNLHAGRFAEAHRRIDMVTNEVHLELKNLIIKNLGIQEKQAATNAPPEKTETDPPAKK
jgi:tetratricopeptide (TPR) repeat protein